MAQTVQLKRSSVANKVPTTSDLALGEIAINTHDGKLFIKKDDGTASIVEIGAGGGGGATDLSFSANSTTVQINSSTGADIVVAGANSTVSGFLTASTQTIGGSKTFKGPDVIFDNGPGGDEGGELKLATAVTNSVLSGTVVIDIFQNKLRIFESGGNNRGAYIDLSAATDGVGSNLLTGGGGSGSTNLTYSANGSVVSIFSDTGTDVTIPGANSSTAGFLTAEAQTIAGTKTFSSTISGSISGNAGTATTLQTARTISLGGDLSGSASFDGSANVTISATIQANSVELGTDTTGDYVSGLTGGTGVTISGSAGEGWSPTVAIGQDVGTTASVQFSNLILSGNLTVNGTTTTISANNLAIQDNLIYLNDGSTVTNPDLGIVGNYNDGSYSHAGVFRDATDNRWKFFKRYDPEPGQTIDTANSTFQYADVQANTFYGDLSGNATTAATLQTARTIALSGDLSGSVSFDGSANVNINATIAADSVALGTDTTGNYVASITNGSYITGGDGGSEGAALTIAVDATSAATASKVVARDSSGNFSANTISISRLTANSSSGSAGQVLTSNGTSVYWSTVSGGGGGGPSAASVSDTAPSSPVDGQLWFDSTSASLSIYYTDTDSSQWVEVVGPTGPTGPDANISKALAMTFLFN